MLSKILLHKFKLSFVYFISLVILLIFVANFSVNVPYGDQWDLVYFFENVSINKLNFVDFFAQHNEHRIVFPRIIIVILAFMTKWNIKYELYFSVFLAFITFLAIYKLSSLQSENQHNPSLHLLNILTSILIFSLVQHENWLWGFQIAWFLINACLVIAILIITLSKDNPERLYFAAIPCFIASFSLIQGLLTWLAVIPSIVSLKSSSRQKSIRIIIWISLFAITCTIYFINYQKPAHKVDIFFFLREPLIAGRYFFTLLGTPLVSESILSPIIGVTVFLSFLILIVRSLKASQFRFKISLEATSWISIGLFVLLFAFITTVGRASFGVEQAMASRYTTSSVLLIISTLYLWQLFSSKSVFVAGIIIGLLLVNSANAIPQAKSLQAERQAGATCLELVNFINESSDSCLESLYPAPSAVRKLAIILEQLGFRRFPKDIVLITNSAKNHGYIDLPPTTADLLTLSKIGSLNIAGWAILPDSQEFPKTVFFSYGNNRSFFANAVINLDSPDVAKALNSSKYSKVRWSANILFNSLPLGETVIKAWVYDPDGKKLIKLNGEPKVKVVE